MAMGFFFGSSRQWAVAYLVVLFCCGSVAAGESFESCATGPFEQLKTTAGSWQAAAEHAEIHRGHAREGKQSLRILGGVDRVVELVLEQPTQAASRFRFWAERWTRQAPFSCRIALAGKDGRFKEAARGDQIKVGGFHTKLEVPLPIGTARIRLTVTSPPGKGLMIDDVEVAIDRPMEIASVEVVQPVMPVFIRKPVNPVVGINIKTKGTLEPLTLEAVELSLAGTTRPEDVAEVIVGRGTADPASAFAATLGAARPGVGTAELRLTGSVALESGDNCFWVAVRLKDNADSDGRVDVRVTQLQVAGRSVAVPEGDPAGSQRIGVAIRCIGDDGVKVYRIPGLVQTNRGTLIAAYDIRYRGSADLPADIDVGVSRSTDGGRTWEPMRVAIDMGRDQRFGWDGVGDPSILVDRETGRIFIAALWSHGNRGWNGSGPGVTPEATGQFVMVASDDDGKTWSAARNITPMVKDPAWRLFFDGPGCGITLADGTLVFPAQFRDAKGLPYSTLIWSKDHGRTWKAGAGAKPNTTEAQLVQLGDGSIMINCRDNRGGSRAVAVTSDLGQTWQLHPTDRKALPESVCMASLIRWDVPGVGPRLFFSNPATTRGRHSMTLKVSADDGATWPDAYHLLYDSRNGYGYSCLAPADDEHLGVLYEGIQELYFLRLPLADVLASGK